MFVVCLFLFRVEGGEKAEKESQSKEKQHAEEPRKSAAKKQKKLKKEGGFQIWSELETQRNKFMVRFSRSVSTGDADGVNTTLHLCPTELPLQELLQPQVLGTVSRLCLELHSSLLQGKK